jgi:hypothetical protein
MRVFFLHILAKLVGVSFRIDGILYGKKPPISLGDSSSASH